MEERALDERRAGSGRRRGIRGANILLAVEMPIV
jgi:hypothetical protein